MFGMRTGNVPPHLMPSFNPSIYLRNDSELAELGRQYGEAGPDMNDHSDDARYYRLLERVTKVEAELKHMQLQQTDTNAKVSTMYEIMLQARGARWILLLAASVGGFLATKIASVTGITNLLSK